MNSAETAAVFVYKNVRTFRRRRCTRPAVFVYTNVCQASNRTDRPILLRKHGRFRVTRRTRPTGFRFCARSYPLIDELKTAGMWCERVPFRADKRGGIRKRTNPTRDCSIKKRITRRNRKNVRAACFVGFFGERSGVTGKFPEIITRVSREKRFFPDRDRSSCL